VVLEYLMSNVARPLNGVSTRWVAVLGMPVTDRVGNRLRTAARDAMIAPVTINGSAFGFAHALETTLARCAVIQPQLHWCSGARGTFKRSSCCLNPRRLGSQTYRAWRQGAGAPRQRLCAGAHLSQTHAAF